MYFHICNAALLRCGCVCDVAAMLHRIFEYLNTATLTTQSMLGYVVACARLKPKRSNWTNRHRLVICSTLHTLPLNAKEAN